MSQMLKVKHKPPGVTPSVSREVWLNSEREKLGFARDGGSVAERGMRRSSCLVDRLNAFLSARKRAGRRIDRRQGVVSRDPNSRKTQQSRPGGVQRAWGGRGVDQGAFFLAGGDTGACESCL